MKLKDLMGSGDKIGLYTLPFLIMALVLNGMYPDVFSVGGPTPIVSFLAVCVLFLGLLVWAWSVVLILSNVPKMRLITTGPYAVVKHPLYTGIALLVIPAIGIMLNTWVMIPVGLVMYAFSRVYSPLEEQVLSRTFGSEWEKYRKSVLLPWL